MRWCTALDGLYGGIAGGLFVSVQPRVDTCLESESAAVIRDTSAIAVADPKESFLSNRKNARTRGCAFCGLLGHRIHGCPAADEYVNTGRVKIVNNRL